jgi:chromosome condensin MukBEF ATPase and DNA-binding subunit MukB
MKIIRRFDRFNQVDQKNRDKLIEEAGDVLCMIELMVEYKLLTDQELRNRVDEKRIKLKQFSKLIDQQ